MKIGFSTLVCPNWDLPTIVGKAAEYGFDGVELRGIGGRLHLPSLPELAGNPQATRGLLASKNVELVCLGSGCTLDSPDRRERARSREELVEFIELASALGCPYVRMFAGAVGPGETRQAVLARVAVELSGLADFAAEKRVTILVQNGGDFCGSADLWYLADSVSRPTVKVCWDPCVARSVRERPTISIPRLSSNIGLVHVCDAEFDDQGGMTQYKEPGTGQVELDRAIELLKGIIFRGYLVFEWPALWDASLAAPEAILPAVAAFMRERVDAKHAVLSAYKGDPQAPKYRSPTSVESAASG